MSLGRSAPREISWEVHTRMLRRLYHNAIANRSLEDTVTDLRCGHSSLTRSGGLVALEGADIDDLPPPPPPPPLPPNDQHSKPHNFKSPAANQNSAPGGSVGNKEETDVKKKKQNDQTSPSRKALVSLPTGKAEELSGRSLRQHQSSGGADDEEEDEEGHHQVAQEVALDNSEDTSDDNQDRVSSNWILCRPEGDSGGMVYRYRVREDNTVEGGYVSEDGVEISIVETPMEGAQEGHVNPMYRSDSNTAEEPFLQPGTAVTSQSKPSPSAVTQPQQRENPPEKTTTDTKTKEGLSSKAVAKSSKGNGRAGRRASKARKALEDEQADEDSKWLSWVEAQFVNIAGEDQEIDGNEFKGALGVKQSFFADRFFSLFDSDNSGTIELPELMDGLRTMTKGTPKEKLKFLFDVYDVDGSGMIDRDELKVVLKSCMEESAMQLSDEDLQDLTDALFDEADEDGSGAITFEELVGQLEKFPGVMENLTMSASNWLKPPAPKVNKKMEKPRYFSKRYIMNNLRKLAFLLIYFLVNAGLSAISVWRYWDSNAAVIVARACGMCLNFNGAFIIVLMLRRVLTWLRSTRAAVILPLDQSIMFHKMVGVVIFFQSMIHTVAHLVNIVIVKNDMRSLNVTEVLTKNETVPVLHDLEMWRWLFTLESEIGWVGPGFAYVSGIVLDVILTIMVVCSMSFVRSHGYFQLFYWTHLLYVAFLVLLILHGPIFWMFFIGPGTIFVVETVLRSKLFKLSKYGHMYITEVNLLPSKVTHIVIARPPQFVYKPGDYVFLNIPAIASQEWHPFTISSAPEREEAVWLHVRSAGHWTNNLYDFFEACPEVDPNMSWKERRKGRSTVLVDAEKGQTVSNGTPQRHISQAAMKGPRKPKGRGRQKFVNVEVYLDGPYGTSTREIFETDHAVLIASGIGVTPYASILQSIARRYAAMRRKCPQCSHIWSDTNNEKFMKLKKVDFIWINRDQKCFEWFVSLLAQLEMDGNEDESFNSFLEMQMFMTAALGKNDMKGVGLQMAMEILHKKDNRDVLTGLKTRTQPGRPNWNEVFAKIQAERKGKVKIFFCGSPALAKSIKLSAETFGFQFSKENF